MSHTISYNEYVLLSAAHLLHDSLIGHNNALARAQIYDDSCIQTGDQLAVCIRSLDLQRECMSLRIYGRIFKSHFAGECLPGNRIALYSHGHPLTDQTEILLRWIDA